MNKIQIYSGGAVGADYELTKNLDSNKFEVHHLYTHLKKSPYGTECITQEQFNEALKFIPIAGNILGRKNYHSNIKYFARDYWIAKNSDVLFGVAYRDIGTDLYEGGSGWTIEFAKLLNKKLCVYDQNNLIYRYYNCNKQDDVLLNVKSIGLFGSRKMTEQGKVSCRYISTFLNEM